MTIYGSVNGQTKKVKKLYGSVEREMASSVTGEVRQGYASDHFVSFDGSTFLNNTFASPYFKVLQAVYYTSSDTVDIHIYYSDGTSATRLTGLPYSALADYGITMDSYFATNGGIVYIDLTPTITTQNVSKEIVKLYGSVNGVTKLVYEA